MSTMSNGPSPRQYEIPILGRCVLRVFVQSGLDMELAEDAGQTAIQIAGPLAVVAENDPLVTPRNAETPAYGKVIVRGNDQRTERRLQIVFAPGVWFRAEPSPPESGTWGPAGSKGLIVISMPGSEIALWFGRRRRPDLAAVSPAAS